MENPAFLFEHCAGYYYAQHYENGYQYQPFGSNVVGK